MKTTVMVLALTALFTVGCAKAGDPAKPAGPAPMYPLTAAEREQVRLAATQFLIASNNRMEALVQDRLGLAIQRDADGTMASYTNLINSIKAAKKMPAECQMDVIKLEFACPTKK